MLSLKMKSIYIIRKQFPLSLSYGITIYKNQGLSLQNAIIDIDISVFSCGHVYIALFESLDGLHLIIRSMQKFMPDSYRIGRVIWRDRGGGWGRRKEI